MEISDLTDEQIKNLTPEQIETLERDPAKLDEIMAGQTATKKPEPEEKGGVANDAGEEDEPVVLNKSGKGVIPYEAHKGLRVENATLKEELQTAKTKLDELLQQKEEAKGNTKATAVVDEAIQKHLDMLKEDMPELHTMFSTVLEANLALTERLTAVEEERKREKEEAENAKAQTIAEQVQEAKENNPDLVHWETSDPEAWDEAMKQDEILRLNAKWNKKPFAERFDEVVRRVRAVMPEATEPNKPSADKAKAEAKAKLEKAPARKPTTLSDIQGGANPTSEKDQLENLSGAELTARLLKMPEQRQAAMRAELE